MGEKHLFMCPRPCPMSKPFCYFGECYSTCQLSTLQYNSTYCIDTDKCKKLGWKGYDNKCVKECPSRTYEIHGDTLNYGDLMVCDAMVPSIVTTVVSVIIIALCCALVRYQLTTKGPATKDSRKANDSTDETRPLLDNDQTHVMDIWTNRSDEQRSRSQHNSAHQKDQYTCNDNASLLDVRIDHASTNTCDIESSRLHGKEDDELSSVPTIVKLRGYQDDSMDISVFSTGSDLGSGTSDE